MSHVRKNFIPRNEGFVCAHCGTQVPPAHGTFRNHCPLCLTSRHVDDTIPGDRAAICHGLMSTISIEGSDPDTVTLVQQCVVCGMRRRNRRAPDDDRIAIFNVVTHTQA
ncbi:MAG: RNHCP domain-containing protein [Candidatus Andersenbacteria bacterium]